MDEFIGWMMHEGGKYVIGLVLAWAWVKVRKAAKDGQQVLAEIKAARDMALNAPAWEARFAALEKHVTRSCGGCGHSMATLGEDEPLASMEITLEGAHARDNDSDC